MNYRTEPLKALKPTLVMLDTNPFALLRKAQNLTFDQLAAKAYVSKQALIRLEQGCFTDPLPSMMDYYLARGESELQLRDGYIAFQEAQRKAHSKLFGDNLSCDWDSPTHPFRQLRNQRYLNPTEVAKALCIPQATILHFERKWKFQQTVPKQLKVALHQADYMQRDIEQFCEGYKTWRENAKTHRLLEDAHG